MNSCCVRCGVVEDEHGERGCVSFVKHAIPMRAFQSGTAPLGYVTPKGGSYKEPVVNRGGAE